MEPTSTLPVLNVMNALPQCIGAAKKLYDLRLQHKDASVLFSAIYSESMVIAASLSQVQTLLQHDALLNKPELLDTFDQALTGCRVVYGCLEEEVQGLVENHALETKEEAFKELLTQIRGQQSALGLLIQGLRMESTPDVRKLVEDNSTKLDQVVKRSKTLRQSHPRISTIPESILRRKNQQEAVADAESILSSTEFAFDDEVINSKAYRRAMATYAAHTDTSTVEFEAFDDDSTALGTVAPGDLARPLPLDVKKSLVDFEKTSQEYSTLSEKAKSPNPAPEKQEEAPPKYTSKGVNDNTLDSLERNMLPFMPSLNSKSSFLTPMRTDSVDSKKERPAVRERALSESFQSKIDNSSSPPTRPGHPRSSSSTSTDSSSYVAYKPPQNTAAVTRKPIRKPLPRVHRASKEILGSYHDGLEVAEFQTPGLEVVEPARRVSESGLEVVKSQLSGPGLLKPGPEVPDPGLEVLKPGRRVSEAGLEVSKPRLEVSNPGLEVVKPGMGASKSVPDVSKPEPPRKILENAEMHEVWTSLVDAESKLFDRMTKFRKMFYDNVTRQWPEVEPHLEVILIGERLAAIHKKLLWLPMEQELIESESASCDPSMFETWAAQAQDIYNDYCTNTPRALGALRALRTTDPKFAPFVNTLGLSIAYFGMGWEDYLKVPLLQLDLYVSKLQTLIDIASTLGGATAKHEESQLSRALDAVTQLRTASTTVLDETQNREDITSLEKRLHAPNPDYLDRLILHEAPRLLKYQGSLTMKLRGRGPWYTVHMVLLDNYLFWGKVKPVKDSKGSVDRIMLVDEPIPVSDLVVTIPDDHHAFTKSTMFDDIPRNTVQYVMYVKRKSGTAKSCTCMLGAPYTERKIWMDMFSSATGCSNPGA